VSGRGKVQKIFVLLGVFGLIAALAAAVVAPRAAHAQAGTTETFTSAQFPPNGGTQQTPDFVEPGLWQMTWTYDCAFGSGFQITINPESSADLGPILDGSSGSGTERYTLTGTFNLTVSSSCTWTITVSPTSQYWDQLPGAATDISIGNDGSVWVLGTNPGPNGYLIYRWTGAGWAHEPGEAVRISVGAYGFPWIVDSHNRIYQLTGGGWVQEPGAATDISVNNAGQVMAVGTNPGPNGHNIYQWTGAGWQALSGEAVRIDVSTYGVWIVDSQRRIYTLDGGGWSQEPGAATDITEFQPPFGGAGYLSVWALGANPGPNGYPIYLLLSSLVLPNSAWVQEPGEAVSIAIGPDGSPWVVNSQHHIYLG
jgi:hypothetical protein